MKSEKNGDGIRKERAAVKDDIIFAFCGFRHSAFLDSAGQTAKLHTV